MKVSALIPAKSFANAKKRLTPSLTPSERKVLAKTMLRDVLEQVVPARGLEGTFVVTANDDVDRLASSLGAGVIREKEENGETSAVQMALAELRRRGVDAVLVLPGDIPLIRSEDVELVLAQVAEEKLDSPFALLVPSHDRMGTNGLLLSPPDVIQLRFGHDSFSYHLGEVAANNLSLCVVENERIALDIDEPKDLQRLLSAGIGGSAYSTLLHPAP